MNLRQHAMRYVGQPIVAKHVNGQTYSGVLHSVSNDGIYIRPHGAGTVSGNRAHEDMEHVFVTDSSNPETEHVFFGLGFLPWLALAGFWGGGLWW